jgi:hypothetical protein
MVDFVLEFSQGWHRIQRGLLLLLCCVLLLSAGSIGNAEWTGVELRGMLLRAGELGATQVFRILDVHMARRKRSTQLQLLATFMQSMP